MGAFVLITLSEIINKNILDNCTILTGANNLSNIVTSVSVLETPDYENYIIENTLILTTLYPIKNDMALFERLLTSLAKKKVSGLAIKLHRYVDNIPVNILELANDLDFPIISLDKDVNFSVLFHEILNEIEYNEYKQINLEDMYVKVLSDVYKHPSSEQLVKSFKSIDGFEILIYNPVNRKIHCSSEELKKLYKEFSKARSTLLHIGNRVLFTEDIYYGNQYIYKLLLLCEKEKQHLLYNIASIYKMLIVFVYQYKQDLYSKQDRFLLNFISNITTQYNTNRDLIEAGLAFDLNIKFPIAIVLVSSSLPQPIQKSFSISIKDCIIRNFTMKENEVSCTPIDNMTLIIANVTKKSNIKNMIDKLYEEFQEYRDKKTTLKIAYSNQIDLATSIPTVYSSLSDTIRQQQEGILRFDIVCETEIQLLSLVKKLNYNDIKDFYYPLIEDLIDYDNKNNTSLIITLYTYFECQFNKKECAKKLFIHINTLKYRLSRIIELGYDVDNLDNSYLSLYLALYIYLYIPSN